jgi:D-3-phosphoglycerate dehydrogenase
MRVAILDDYFDTLRTLPCFSSLAGHDVVVWTDHVDDPDVLAERLQGIEALVLIRERTPIRRHLIERLPSLRLISQRSVYPHIDVDACTEHGVLVCSNLHAGSPSYATAELTWALVLAAMRRLPDQVESMKAGRWQSGVGRSLVFKTLGVYGYGRIGKVVASYGHAFGMHVQAWGTEGSRQRAAADGVHVPESREAFFSTSDVVSLHLRLVAATQGLVRRGDLALMKPDSVLVNTSRAGLVEDGALVDALDRGRPGMAAIDVYDEEPITAKDHPLVRRHDVICTPHIGYVTVDEWELQFRDVFDQINAFAAGEPLNPVNSEVLAGDRTIPSTGSD